MPVWTVRPCQMTSFGRPTFTDSRTATMVLLAPRVRRRSLVDWDHRLPFARLERRLPGRTRGSPWSGSPARAWACPSRARGFPPRSNDIGGYALRGLVGPRARGIDDQVGPGPGVVLPTE